MEERRGRSRRGADLSNLAFRPRPIDVNRPIPIIRHEIEDEESAGVSRSVPKMPTGMEHEDEEEIHIQNAIAASLVPSAETTVIPTPSVRLVESYFTTKHPETWSRPQAYVKYKGKLVHEQVEASTSSPLISHLSLLALSHAVTLSESLDT
jgi:hypothetical protein